MLKKIREAIKGKKSYLLATATIIVTVVAWASGEITDTQGIAAVVVAVQSMFLRAGIAKT